MKKPIAVCFADLHLQERAWAGRPIDGDSYHAFRQIVDYAVNHKIRSMVGAGDLLDRQQNRSGPIVQLGEQLRELREHQIDFCYIQGQHEMDNIPWLDSFPGTFHLHRAAWDLGPFTAYGIDYQPVETLAAELAAIPAGTDILFAHQTWTDFMGEKAATQGLLGDIPVVKTCFTGDYHKNVELNIRGADGQPLHVISPGSTCMQAIDESPKKFFYVLNDDGSWEKVPLLSRPLIEWGSLANESDVDRFVETFEAELEAVVKRAANDRLPADIAKPLLWLRYSHHVAEAVRSRVPRVVADRAFLFYKEAPPEQPDPVDGEIVTRSEAGGVACTLESEMESYLSRNSQQHLANDCLRLLQSPDPAETVRQLREEALR